MTTFGGWLDDQASPALARQDPIGDLARAWLAARGDRPRVFAPESVSAWILAHLPEQLHAAVGPAVRDWRADRGEQLQQEPLPGMPPEPGPAAQERARAIAQQAGWLPGDEPAPGAGEPAHRQPPPQVTSAEPGIIPGEPVIPYVPEPAAMAALGRIERDLAAMVRAVEQLEEREMGVQEQLTELLAWTAKQEARIGPLERLLADLGAAEDAADQADAGADLAEAYRRTENAAVQGGLWAAVRAAPPDMDRLAALGEGEAGDPGE